MLPWGRSFMKLATEFSRWDLNSPPLWKKASWGPLTISPMLLWPGWSRLCIKLLVWFPIKSLSVSFICLAASLFSILSSSFYCFLSLNLKSSRISKSLLASPLPWEQHSRVHIMKAPKKITAMTVRTESGRRQTPALGSSKTYLTRSIVRLTLFTMIFVWFKGLRVSFRRSRDAWKA